MLVSPQSHQESWSERTEDLVKLLQKGNSFFQKLHSFLADAVMADNPQMYLSQNHDQIDEFLGHLEEIRFLIWWRPPVVAWRDLYTIAHEIKRKVIAIWWHEFSNGSTVESSPMTFKLVLTRFKKEPLSVNMTEIIMLGSLAWLILNIGLPILAIDWKERNLF